ncbi:hypothetical protein LJC11_04970 [Bacteroidales bacterium OttesenSCG-928-I21]|nr:hypothetical protein [Bacteroidales bacterium OttesenSCG-928-I21]
MKNFKNILIVAVIAVITFGSCEKLDEVSDNSSETVQSQLKDTPPVIAPYLQPEILTNIQLMKIGQDHNDNLEKVFVNFNWESKDFKQELINNFKLNSIPLKKYSDEDLYSRCCYDFFDNYNLLKNKLSEFSIKLIDNALLMTEDIKSIKGFNDRIDIFKENARSELKNNNEELNSLLVTLEVLKYSAYFWSPKSVGGSGVGYDYILRKEKAKEKVKEIIAADGVSAGVGMIGVAVAGACGPIGWIALAIVAGEAALSSGAAALLQK